MSEFKVDSEKVKESIEMLRTLLDKCEEAYNKEIPRSDIDKGFSHDEMDKLCEKMKTTCQYFGELINNTIVFLNGSSEMFDTSDSNSADAISEGTTIENGSSGIIHGGCGDQFNQTLNGETNTLSFESRLQHLQSKEGFQQGSSGPKGYDWMNYVSVYSCDKGSDAIGGASCFAMAHMMQVELYGRRGNPIANPTKENVKVGDIIHYYGDGADINYGHWVLVTEVSGDNVTVAEGNWKYGKVGYGRQINMNNISIKRIDRV